MQQHHKQRIVIIGAGGAGICCARELTKQGYQNVIILEARNRIGGRAYTELQPQIDNIALELGAEFIHGENTITHQFLQEANMQAIPVSRKPNMWWKGPNDTHARHHSQLDALQKQAWKKLSSDYASLEHFDKQQDMSLAAYLKQRGWSNDASATYCMGMADVILAQTCCTSIDRLGCKDLQHEMKVSTSGDEEFRIDKGYTKLLSHLAMGLNIILNTQVKCVQWERHKGCRLQCQDGKVYVADKIVVTVPIGVLQHGGITFSPALPEYKHVSIQQFDMAPATKLIYVFNRTDLWSPTLTYMGQYPGVTCRWWTPFFGKGIEKYACMASYITANNAAIIDNMKENDALALGLQELSQLIQVPLETLQKHIVLQKRVSWAHDKFAFGAYASIPPHCLQARFDYELPVHNILFFAGEAAAHFSNPQTVHGAFDSGIRTAQTIMNENEVQSKL